MKRRRLPCQYRSRRPVVLSAVFFLVMALAACAAEKQRALYSPLDGKTPYYDNYGYRETKTADGVIEVTYLSRDEGTVPFLDYVERMQEALEQRAHDFALWRAAEATLENGYTHFTVEETSTKTRKHIVGRDPDLIPYRDMNYMVLIGYPGYRTNIWMQPMVTLIARPLSGAEAGSLDAGEIVARFESKYPLAREPVAPAPIPR